MKISLLFSSLFQRLIPRLISCQLPSQFSYQFPSHSQFSSRNRSLGIPSALFFALGLMVTLASSYEAVAQTEPVNGMKVNTPSVVAFTNATIYVSPDEVVENGTLVIRNGKVEAAGANVAVPADARVMDMSGKTIYPGLIDPFTNVGMAKQEEETESGARSWNPHLRAQMSASEIYHTEDEGIEGLRKQGFTTVLTAPDMGIFRGQAAVTALKDGPVSSKVIRSGIAQSTTLTTSWDFGFAYPTSAIGVIAFLRQTLYDADWYERAWEAYLEDPASVERPETNEALEALGSVVRGETPLIFETRSDEEIQRVFRLAEEFEIRPWVLGNGHEYKIADVLAGAGVGDGRSAVELILPVALPEDPDVDTPEDALNASLADLRHAYLAPGNAGVLEDAGVAFSFSSFGLEKPEQFWPSARRAVEKGVSREGALAAMTVRPAELLGISETHGTLDEGKTANFIIATGDLFEKETKLLDVWVEGERYHLESIPELDLSGSWSVTGSPTGDMAAGEMAVGEMTMSLSSASPGKYKGTVSAGGKEADLKTVAFDEVSRRFHATFQGDSLGFDGMVRWTASLTGETLRGWGEYPAQDRVEWSAKRVEAGDADDAEDANDSEDAEDADSAEDADPSTRNKTKEPVTLANIRPAMEYGREEQPEQPKHLLIRNATIWTMGPQGVLENADLYIKDGKVEAVGQDLREPRGAVVIDAEGKHVTPGLIDAHLHSGVDAVNEFGNAIVPEVRMADVLNINNIWMYRQLAGGLTTAHVMHGSANPIGGQNVHIKMKWGALSDELVIEDAPGTVKFALGENPKRVGTDRYPDTRMGVEQIMADRFQMARDYRARWNEWERTGEGLPPRKDLRLEALEDILNGDLLVQSHSYRQDEILMLMRLAEANGFRVKAFHHGVEAFKVAPELAEHGAGAVVWTDWSSFKIEAFDATVYNARLLHEAGVLTSLHSDNSQIASRMNWEAAKMVRAGMTPVEALSLITSTTAKLLGVDHRVGSLEKGKDGDFVIWSGDPLSTATKAEQTWIEGRRYFDLEEDALRRDAVDKERDLLIQHFLGDK